jgi:hypothetical protein
MKHNYTRQRQGRDFSVQENPNNAPPKDDSDAKKSLHDRLEHYKAEAERNSTPIDGNEPVPERGI